MTNWMGKNKNENSSIGVAGIQKKSKIERKWIQICSSTSGEVWILIGILFFFLFIFSS